MNYIDLFKNGSGIHIKKANRGKFTDYCGGHVTEECIRRGKNSSNPTTRKRANFAWVARHKFHHEDGGIIKAVNGTKTLYRAEKNELPEYITNRLENIINAPSYYESSLVTSTVLPEDRTSWLSYNLVFGDHSIDSNKKPYNWERSRLYTKNIDYYNLTPSLKGLILLFDEEGIDVRITSGYRAGALTKLKNVSKHSLGEAMDIVPVNGDFNALDLAIRNNQRIKLYMKAHGYGVIREDNDEMLRKTGGTAYHFHIGTDNLAKKYWLA